MMILQNLNFHFPKILKHNLIVFCAIVFIHIICPQTLRNFNFDLLSIWLACVFLSEKIYNNIALSVLACLFLESYYGLPFTYFTTKIIGLGLLAYSFKTNLSTEKSRTWFLFSIFSTLFYCFHMLCFFGFGQFKLSLFLNSVSVSYTHLTLPTTPYV